jgi:hypothetical protein
VLNGKEYNVKPLQDRQFEELNNWIRSEIIRTAESATIGLTQSRADRLLQSAIKAAATVSWNEPEGIEIIASARGMRKLAEIMLSSNYNVSEEFLRTVTSSQENVNEVQKVFQLQLGMTEEDIADTREELLGEAEPLSPEEKND